MAKGKTTSRAALIRKARKGCKSLRAKELDRLYVEGYEKRPEELDWAEASVKLLSKRLPRDRQDHRGRGKPSGGRRPPRIKGPSMADAVIEDRR